MTATLTPSAEVALYCSDRPAWLRYVAPRMAARINAMTDAELATTWSKLARDYQLAVWDHLDEPMRSRVRTALGARELERAA